MAFTASPVPVQWPEDGVIAGLWLGTEAGTDFDLAHLEVAISDAQGQAIVSDSLGGATPFASALALLGEGHRWFPLHRIVRAGDVWIFQLRNTHPGPVLVVPHVIVELVPAHLEGRA